MSHTKLAHLPFTGGARALVHGHLHPGDGRKDPGRRLHPPQEQLPQESVEHHGLCRRCVGVIEIVWDRDFHMK